MFSCYNNYKIQADSYKRIREENSYYISGKVRQVTTDFSLNKQSDESLKAMKDANKNEDFDVTLKINEGTAKIKEEQ